MRRKKHKSTRRAVKFYKLHYGFREPFKVLLDGNFIHTTSQANINDLEDAISKLLGAKVKLYTTRCVSHELKDLGPEFHKTVVMAKKHGLHKCEHESSPVAAADCLQESVGSSNEGHWWIATQDISLREALHKVAGVPCIFATANGVHLDVPSDVAKSTAKQVETQHMTLQRHELQSEALKDLEALRPKMTTNVKFRKKHAKGPNPLAIKKRKTKHDTAAPQAQQGAASVGDGSSKRRRRQKTKAAAEHAS